VRPYLKKNPIQNRAGGVAEVVKHLPSKCEALSSNSSTTKKKKSTVKKKKQCILQFLKYALTKIPINDNSKTLNKGLRY
jgi:hypothetical protein